jgi:raffinose/stachyose/melibiose transport system substrate-binding protein
MGDLFRVELSRRDVLRLGGAAIVTSAVAPILSACLGSSTNSSSATGTVRVQQFTGSPATSLAKTVQAFQQANPGIKVQVETVNTDTGAAPNTAVLSSNDPPDVGWLEPGSGVEGALLKNNDLVNLQPLWNKLNLESRYDPGTLSSQFKDPSRRYAVLTDAQYIVQVFYKPSVFAKANVTPPSGRQFASMDDFYTMCSQLRAAGLQPLGVGGNTFYDGFLLDSLLATAGDSATFQQYLTDWNPSMPETVKYTDPPFVSVLQTLVDWTHHRVFNDGFLGLGGNQVMAAFAAGKVATFVGGSFSIPDLVTAGASLNDLDWFMLPSITPGNKTPQLIFAGNVFVIPAHAKRQDLAQKFLEFFLDPFQIARYASDEGAVSPYKQSLVPQSVVQGYSAQLTSILASRTDFGVQQIWDTQVPKSLGQAQEIPLLQGLMGGQLSVQQCAAKFQANLEATRADPNVAATNGL